jgi:predicted AlkP superfamily phosphohydrolase/phosphomutase
VAVIGLDGLPYTFLTRMVSEGRLPNFARILAAGDLRPINSVYPPVSSAAWASFATGKNPAKHGVFGFSERQAGSYKTYIPTSRHLKGDTLWEILSRRGKRVVVMNVPVSYPPRPVNGVLVSCFLTPDLSKGVYPPSLYPTLKEMGYRLDMDPWVARESRAKMTGQGEFPWPSTRLRSSTPARKSLRASRSVPTPSSSPAP